MGLGAWRGFAFFLCAFCQKLLVYLSFKKCLKVRPGLPVSCFGVVCLPPSSLSWVAKLQIETAVGIDLKVFPLRWSTVPWKGTWSLVLANLSLILSELYQVMQSMLAFLYLFQNFFIRNGLFPCCFQRAILVRKPMTFIFAFDFFAKRVTNEDSFSFALEEHMKIDCFPVSWESTWSYCEAEGLMKAARNVQQLLITPKTFKLVS